MSRRRYTKRQQEVMTEWFDFTGWSFMEPHRGELFTDAIKRNRRWLYDRARDAEFIGEDLMLDAALRGR